MKSLLCSILHIFVTKKQLFFFFFFHLSRDSFLCCCLKQKIVCIWFEKSRCVECLIMLAGASLQVLLISHFFFAISFLSSLSFKVLNWSKLSSDTSRLDPISIRSRLETFYRSRLGSEWRRKAMRPMFSQTDSNCFCNPHLKERKQKTLKNFENNIVWLKWILNDAFVWKTT